MRSLRAVLRSALGSVLVLLASLPAALAGAALFDTIASSEDDRAHVLRVALAVLATVAGCATITAAVRRLRGTIGRWPDGEMSFALTVLLVVAWAFVTYAATGRT
jgi:hypothetical protein